MADPLTIIHGDCVEVMRSMDEASVDAIVTDPRNRLGRLMAEGAWVPAFDSIQPRLHTLPSRRFSFRLGG